MSDDAGDLVDAEPRRRPGDGEPRAALGRSPLREAPVTGRGVLDALLAHDAWTREHGARLRGTRAGDVHLPARVEAAAPVVAVEVERATAPAPTFGGMEDHRTLGIETSETAPGVSMSEPSGHEPTETAALDVETLDIAERMRRMRERMGARG